VTVGRIALLVTSIVAIQLAFGAGSRTAANSFSPPYLWEDFRAGGDGRVTYTLCTESLPGEASWGTGTETWDDVLGPTMDLDFLSGCTGAAQTILRWEPSGQDPCGIAADGTVAVACWKEGSPTDMGTYWRLSQTTIYFDRIRYPAQPSDPRSMIGLQPQATSGDTI
jgi:hypothetical protein